MVWRIVADPCSVGHCRSTTSLAMLIHFRITHSSDKELFSKPVVSWNFLCPTCKWLTIHSGTMVAGQVVCPLCNRGGCHWQRQDLTSSAHSHTLMQGKVKLDHHSCLTCARVNGIFFQLTSTLNGLRGTEHGLSGNWTCKFYYWQTHTGLAAYI